MNEPLLGGSCLPSYVPAPTVAAPAQGAQPVTAARAAAQPANAEPELSDAEVLAQLEALEAESAKQDQAVDDEIDAMVQADAKEQAAREQELDEEFRRAGIDPNQI